MQIEHSLKSVLIMAGGTGGHVFPGLALAHYLRDRGVSVHWLGTNPSFEARVVAEADFPLHFINIGGVRGKGFKTLLAAPIKIIIAIVQAMRVIRKLNPDVVIGMGGFVSGPGGFASWLLRRPLIIHEQNAKAGLTNKILAYFAKRVLQGFPQAFKPKAKVLMIGNPVRAEIATLPPPQLRLQPTRVPLRLLVLGGSLGAKALNEIVPRALLALQAAERPRVLHQTGEKHFTAVEEAYAASGVAAELTPFIRDMAEAYAWADVVLCRAGALTVTELCTVGLGAVFVPFPHAVDDHQTANAYFMVKQQAALCIQQTELTEKRLAAIVREFTAEPKRCLAMAEAAYQLRHDNVTEKIFNICKEICP